MLIHELHDCLRDWDRFWHSESEREFLRRFEVMNPQLQAEAVHAFARTKQAMSELRILFRARPHIASEGR